MPGMAGPPPSPSPDEVPGVSEPSQGPGDQMSQLAEKLGGMQGNSTMSAAVKIREAMKLLREAGSMDPKIRPLIMAMMAPVTQGMPQGPASGMQGPVPPGGGMPQAGPPMGPKPG